VRAINTAPAPFALLTFSVVIGIACLFGIVEIVELRHEARAARALADTVSAGLTRCAPPRHPGDRTLITVLHTGAELAVTCRHIAHVLSPERINP
jgi:hypothetical protein